MAGYLPKENEDSVLNKSVLRAIWTNKVVVNALGVRNENEAREWFRTHPQMHAEFAIREMELDAKIKELQKQVYDGLREVVTFERGKVAGFVNNNVNYIVKEEPK